MGAESPFKDFVVGQLSGVPGIECQPMFGGFGLAVGPRFFGIVFQGRLYLRTDAGLRARHEAAGMGPFRFFGMTSLESFYEVPEAVVGDAGQLVAWVEQSLRVA